MAEILLSRTRTKNLIGELEFEDQAGVYFFSNSNGPNLHPLWNPYILERIFDYLTFADLKTCRLVNKLWEEEANAQLIPRSIIVIENLHRMEKYIKEFLLPPEANRSKFAQMLGNSVHFNESKLIEWEDKSATLDPTVVEFIVTNGKCIKILTLDLCKTPEPHLRQILQSEQLINLEKVIVKSEVEESVTGWRSMYPSFPINVLPSVTELEIAEHKVRFYMCGMDRIGSLIPCDPWRLNDLVQALPNLRTYTKNQNGKRQRMVI